MPINITCTIFQVPSSIFSNQELHIIQPESPNNSIIAESGHKCWPSYSAHCRGSPLEDTARKANAKEEAGGSVTSVTWPKPLWCSKSDCIVSPLTYYAWLESVEFFQKIMTKSSISLKEKACLLFKKLLNISWQFTIRKNQNVMSASLGGWTIQ